MRNTNLTRIIIKIKIKMGSQMLRPALITSFRIQSAKHRWSSLNNGLTKRGGN